jgi:ABC-type iron transport system FetAB ATPase subunit
VALALVGRPTVLLLDVPTAGVDEPGQEKRNELVRRVQAEEGLTVLLISQDPSVVYRDATDAAGSRHLRDDGRSGSRRSRRQESWPPAAAPPADETREQRPDGTARRARTQTHGV